MSIKNQAEEEDCEPCRFAVGIGFMLNICKDLKKDGKDIDCADIEKQVKANNMSVKEFTEKIKERIVATNDMASLDTYEEVNKIMFKKRGK